ncbi:phosphatase PAP2 family protein [Streptomyces sp. NPDC093085]|uniref:phosphatase PAP2 family protein n=1 Tax=Streptomyces sp. NPDC093085 TaxID=3155068 RepID=UPI00342B36B0
MTSRVPSSLATRPETRPETPRASWPVRPAALAALPYGLAFLAVYLLAVLTPFGQRAENFLFGPGEVGARPAWVYGLSGSAYGSSAMPPLEMTAMPTLLVGIAVIAAVAVVRRCWWQGVAAVGVVVLTLGSKEFARMVLPRPDWVGARESLLEASFPSGHAAIPAALVLGAVLVAAPRFRPYVALVGTGWFAVTAGAVLATYHHRLSDVLGATLLACAAYTLVVRLLPPSGDGAPAEPAAGPRIRPALALVVSAAAAFPAGARSDSLTQSLAFGGTAFVCACLFWWTACRGPARTARPGPARTSASV